MVELMEAIRVFREALAGGDRKAIRISAAALLCAIGDAWLALEQRMPFGDGSDVDVADELCGAIEDLGGEVPKEGGLVMSILFSTVIKLLLEQLKGSP
jgi:hypothetical protein